ncbi:alpha/beta hydrolase [Candidatus Dojkabacteria bacterium]|nr:alpha/beta hydrolase [Candidatus Dojkabacteria bacterium]
MSKFPLIILGGIGDTGEKSYSLLIKELEKDFQIIKISYPGFGGTSKPKEATLEADVEIIRKHIKSLNLKELIIFSHSIGTAYAFELCYPNDLYIRALIAANPFTIQNKNLISPFIRGMRERRKLNQWLKANNKKIEFRPFSYGSLKYLSSYLRIAKIFRKIEVKDDLSKSEIPMLAMIGDFDTLIPKQIQMRNLDLIKHLQITHLNDGHYFIHTQAPKIAKLITKFANEQGITL